MRACLLGFLLNFSPASCMQSMGSRGVGDNKKAHPFFPRRCWTSCQQGQQGVMEEVDSSRWQGRRDEIILDSGNAVRGISLELQLL